jgi:hypothetical protein
LLFQKGADPLACKTRGAKLKFIISGRRHKVLGGALVMLIKQIECRDLEILS